MPITCPYQGRPIYVDHWVDNKFGQVNRHLLATHKADIEDYWHVTATHSDEIGKEYIRLKDGRSFWRPDVYAVISPYGWNEIIPAQTCHICGRADMHNCERPDCPF